MFKRKRFDSPSIDTRLLILLISVFQANAQGKDLISTGKEKWSGEISTERSKIFLQLSLVKTSLGRSVFAAVWYM